MSRAPKQPLIFHEKIKIPKEFLKFATPKEVANYRAEKLKCNLLVEIGAGIGGQTIAFSRKCKRVIAVELNKERAKILNDNLKKLKIKNVGVINGDALNKSVIQKISKEKPEIIFMDTERPEESKRTLEQIQPPIEKILESYLPITKKIAIEIPPFTQDVEKLKKDYVKTNEFANRNFSHSGGREGMDERNQEKGYNFEEEFISLNGQLNRLTLYFNELKTYEKSAIALPSKEKITNSLKKIKPQEVSSAMSTISNGKMCERKPIRLSSTVKNFSFLYSIDPTIIVSNLIDELAEKLNFSILNISKPLLLSNKEKKSYFLTSYRILKICRNDETEILDELKKIGAGKVTLRFSVDPKDYWKIRNFYESKLEGKKEISLFINEKNNEAVICEKI